MCCSNSLSVRLLTNHDERQNDYSQGFFPIGPTFIPGRQTRWSFEGQRWPLGDEVETLTECGWHASTFALVTANRRASVNADHKLLSTAIVPKRSTHGSSRRIRANLISFRGFSRIHTRSFILTRMHTDVCIMQSECSLHFHSPAITNTHIRSQQYTQGAYQYKLAL